MRLLLIVVLLLGACIFLLSVRVIFGRRKEFLQGHACRGVKSRSSAGSSASQQSQKY